MIERIEELSAELAFHEDAGVIAEGSVLEAIRNGQFDRARVAIDAAEDTWNQRLELCDEISEIVAYEPELPAGESVDWDRARRRQPLWTSSPPPETAASGVSSVFVPRGRAW